MMNIIKMLIIFRTAESIKKYSVILNNYSKQQLMQTRIYIYLFITDKV